MAFTTINKSSDHFKAIKYTGTGSSNAITGVGHQPDFLWIKKANGVEHHILIDAVRGLDKQIYSSHTSSEDTNAQSVTAVGADGFTVGTNAQTNANSSIFIAQLWKAGGGSGSANADGSISSTVSTNTTAGFSIVKWVGTGANATIGHGLGVAPSLLISKNYDTATNWYVYHKSLGATKNVRLNLTNASATETAVWNDTAPTNSVFSVGTNTSVNNSGDNTITYCFAEKKGFSKFGQYYGDGSADGPFIYTGFKPAFIILKRVGNAGNNWNMIDTKRSPSNDVDKILFPSSNDAEVTTTVADILSTGFKIRLTSSGWNHNQDKFVYMAFAEEPLVSSNNIPATAR
jgi:hypothetical protein